MNELEPIRFSLLLPIDECPLPDAEIIGNLKHAVWTHDVKSFSKGMRDTALDALSRASILGIIASDDGPDNPVADLMKDQNMWVVSGLIARDSNVEFPPPPGTEAVFEDGVEATWSDVDALALLSAWLCAWKNNLYGFGEPYAILWSLGSGDDDVKIMKRGDRG